MSKAIQTSEQEPTQQTVDLDQIGSQAAEAEQTPVSKAEEEAAKAEDEANAAGAQQAAAMVMVAVKMGVGIIAPYVDIPAKQEKDVIESCAPLFEKYGMHMGGAWAVEIKAALALAGLGGGIYMQIKKHELQKAANDQSKGGNDAGQREPVAA